MYQVTDVEKLTMCHSAQVLSDSHTKRRIDERTNRRPQDSTPQLHTMHTAVIYTINVPDAVTLGGAYNGSRASVTSEIRRRKKRKKNDSG